MRIDRNQRWLAVAVGLGAVLWSGGMPAAEPRQDESASGVSRRPIALYRVAGRTTGGRLREPSAAPIRPAIGTMPGAGRVTPLDRRSFSVLRKVKKGDRVSLPLTDRITVKGTVNLVQEDSGGYVRLAGPLADGAGSFFLNTNGTEVSGMIQLVTKGLAYRVDDDGGSKVLLREVLRSDVIDTGAPQR